MCKHIHIPCQRFASSDDNHFGWRFFDMSYHFSNRSCRMIGCLPTFFDIAPMATYITASDSDKISGNSRISTFSLNGIEMLHKRKFNPLYDSLFYVIFLCQFLNFKRLLCFRLACVLPDILQSESYWLQRLCEDYPIQSTCSTYWIVIRLYGFSPQKPRPFLVNKKASDK